MSATLTCPHCNHTRQPLRSTLEAMLNDAVKERGQCEDAQALYPAAPSKDYGDWINCVAAASFNQGAAHAISAILKLAKL